MTRASSNTPSRRTFLKQVSGAAAIPLLAKFSPVSAASIDQWDTEVDVVVIGSGAAGFSAALFADDAGADVVILEKGPTAGGTTARSGGVAFIPNNHVLRKAGITETKEEFLKYAVRVCYPAFYNPSQPHFGAPADKYVLLEAYYDNASDTTESLEKMGALTFIALKDHEGKPFIDNFPEIPENTCSRGRSICCLPEVIQEGRYYYPDNGGFGIDLINELQNATNKRRIPLLTRHAVKNLVINDDGEVVGVVADTRKGEKKIGGRRGVIFGSGGYIHNKELRDDHMRGRVYGGCATPNNQGDFLKMSGAVDAAVGNLDSGWWMECLLEEAVVNSDVATKIWVVPSDSAIMVNRYGKRFCNEKNQPIGRGQTHLEWDPVAVEYPNLVSVMIWDQRAVDLYAGIYGIQAKTGGLPPHIIQGKNVAELQENIAARLAQYTEHTGNASLCSAFDSNLKETIERYNQFAKDGIDQDFHRGTSKGDSAFHFYGGTPRVENPYPNELMHPIEAEGPYFATLVVAGAIDTKGGPQTNASAQIISYNGDPVPGLYGAGNCIASLTEDSYWGAGGTIGPAMVFGKIAGQHAAKSSPRKMVARSA